MSVRPATALERELQDQVAEQAERIEYLSRRKDMWWRRAGYAEAELAEARELLRIAWSEIHRPDLANRVDAFLAAYDEARSGQAG